MSHRTSVVAVATAATAALVLGVTVSSSAAPQPQAAVSAVSTFPSPSPLVAFDWGQRALDFDAFVFDWDAPGDYPTIGTDTSAVNMTGSTFQMPSYYGDTRIDEVDGAQEAVTLIGSVLNGALMDVDKTDQDGRNYVDMLRTFFHPDLGVALNGQIDFDMPNTYCDDDTLGEGGGTTWWYTTLANVLYYMVGAEYPDEPGMEDILRSIADEFTAMVDDLGGPAANFYAQGYDFRKDEPWFCERNEGGDGAIGTAAILLWAYDLFGDDDYLQRAIWAMDWIERSNGHQNYEVLPNLGPYVAARLNAEHGTDYDLTRLYDDLIAGSTERWDWGTSIGSWNGVDVTALQGQRNGYAYSMNSFAGALMTPAAKYDPRYADVVGRWMLSLADNAQVFYPDRLAAANQQHGSRFVSDVAKVLPYEGLRLSEGGASPMATSDVPYYGLNPQTTHLSLYSGSFAGFLGATVEPTNVAGVQRIDLNALDFYGDSLPTYLYYNPGDSAVNVQVPLAATSSIYDAVSDSVLVASASGTATISVPAGSSRVAVIAPPNPTLTRENGQTLIGDVVVGYRSTTVDLAEGRPVAASTSVSPAVATNLVDGKSSTRWASTASDAQWIQVALAAPGTVNRVELNWERAAARDYEVQVSTDGSSWTSVHTETAGDGGVDSVEFAPVTAAYVRVLMTERINPAWGYSLYAFEVYRDDLALARPVTVSSTTNGNVGAYLTDGLPATRWESQQIDPSGLQVDLGGITPVSRVVIDWEAAYAATFEVWTSTDGVNWTKRPYTGTGGRQVVTFAETPARYVFVYLTSRATVWNYSIYSIEVYAR